MKGAGFTDSEVDPEPFITTPNTRIVSGSGSSSSSSGRRNCCCNTGTRAALLLDRRSNELPDTTKFHPLQIDAKNNYLKLH
eukprot:CAMPEP_0194761964 /NCGR_PEP_ID=MMETSP0323_2-20130528/14566_1 /TAXON_ID=2866 ORGANISM="Crypthecodinium cohnii, Strain Seligo" /NCGR_SAMPLE_ID=MMETSP0323_2 /ASSEMBLY_ACC=CAM_ASM_000346 /LENGTH=80 /DNA_ID=CAMNT_0039683931 /DNA_START=220 /DNA_END=462 /DNA_ORIENTATION=-